MFYLCYGINCINQSYEHVMLVFCIWNHKKGAHQKSCMQALVTQRTSISVTALDYDEKKNRFHYYFRDLVENFEEISFFTYIPCSARFEHFLFSWKCHSTMLLSIHNIKFLGRVIIYINLKTFYVVMIFERPNDLMSQKAAKINFMSLIFIKLL